MLVCIGSTITPSVLADPSTKLQFFFVVGTIKI